MTTADRDIVGTTCGSGRGSVFGILGAMTDDIIDFPLAYLITFRCYGTWLHGDERGSIDRHNRRYGMPTYPKTEHWQKISADRMKRPPVKLTARMRKAVEKAIRETCGLRNWTLLAINVRTNHVHVVVAIGSKKPGVALNALKANATREMRSNGCWLLDVTPWADKGSQRYLWNQKSVAEAIDYVTNRETTSNSPPATAGGTDLRSLLLCLRTPGRPRRDCRPPRSRVPTRVNRQKNASIGKTRKSRQSRKSGIAAASRIMAS